MPLTPTIYEETDVVTGTVLGYDDCYDSRYCPHDFYKIRLSDPDPDAVLNKIVSWCNKYPQKGISIKGYADRGTGNPKINVGYAKARAEKVAKALQDKGIAASRMTVESFGDTVQPFDENDRNRCVIVVGE